MEQSGSWRILLPVGIGTAFSLMGDATMYAVLPTHTAVVGVTLLSVGILLSANRWVRLIANGVAGWLSDRFSKRGVFVTALFVGALSTAVYGFTVGFWPLFVGRLLWGIAWAGIWVAGNGLVLEAAPAAQRGKWVGNYHLSFFLGAGLGALLGGFLTDSLGFQTTMRIAAALSLLGAVIALLFVPHVAQSPLPREQEDTPEPVEKAAKKRIRWGEVISATAVLGINRFVIAGIFVATMGVYLLDIFGESVQINGRTVGNATLTGIVLGVNTLLSMVLTPLVGRLSDQRPNRWSVVAAGVVPGIVGFLLLAISFPFAILLGVPLTSISSSSNQSLSTALIGDLGSAKRNGRFLGTLYTVGDLGSAIGPLLAFAILPIWGISSLYWLNVFLFVLLWGTAVYWARKISS